MSKVQVFDPAMCCSTGVCGPSVDPVLVQFGADLVWLKSKGVSVERANLSLQPQAFATSPIILEEMQKQGVHCLPVLLIDDQIAFRGAYPTRAELADRLGLDPSEDFEFLPMAQLGGDES